MLIFPIVSGCATSLISVEDEQAAGASMDRQVEDQMGLYADEYLTTYIDSVGRRLVAELGNTPYSFRFRIVEQAEPNAFATPGGYIYLSRGILAQINNEQELAGILAHEISHVTLRHHARQAGRGVVPGLLTLPGKAVGKVVGKDVGDMINAPIEAAGQVYLSSFSRSQETEADREGMRLAARAGYDPAALATALDTLGQSVALMTGEQQKFSFYDTHPTTPTRVSDIEREAAGIQWFAAPPFVDQVGLFKRLNGLWWGPDNPSQGLFRDRQFLQPDIDFTMTFPPEWVLLNTPRFVGAIEPEQQAFIALGGGGPPVDPTEAANRLIAELRQQADVEPAESRAIEVGDWPAHVVRFEDASGEEPVSLYYLFIRSPRSMFQVIGIGAESYREAMRDTVLSLRNLTPEERESIDGLRLRVETAAAGERFDTLGERAGNVWSPEFTAVMNGMPADAELGDGQLIKVIRREQY